MSDHSADPRIATADITEQSNEDNPAVVAQFHLIIECLGIETAYTVLEESLSVEAKGDITQERPGRQEWQ